MTSLLTPSVRTAFLLALLAGLAWGCGSSDDGWETKEPAEAGFDQAALEELTDDIRAGEYGNIHAVLVEHDGKLVYEEYFTAEDQPTVLKEGGGVVDVTPGPVTYDAKTKHDLNSITKSVTSALLGVALGPDFDSELDRPILDFFPEKADLAEAGLEAVTLRHALTMSAGLRWTDSTGVFNDTSQMYLASDPVAYVLSRPMQILASPGELWQYNTGLTQILGA